MKVKMERKLNRTSAKREQNSPKEKLEYEEKNDRLDWKKSLATNTKKQ